MKKEILSPAGDFIMLHACIKNGADAVYFGFDEFNMRANAKNFSFGELGEVIDICHRAGVKAYLTLNTIIYESELVLLENFFKKLSNFDIDAVIAWDFGVLSFLKKYGFKIHISTQASVSNSKSFLFFVDNFDVDAVVLARECLIEDVKKIAMVRDRFAPNVRIEAFVHGAMCTAISGRCFLSAFSCGKSANRGECAQICRRKFYFGDEKNEGQDFEVYSDFMISAKDLCTIEFLDVLVNAGIDIFKIEGRGRNPEYSAVVTQIYKQALIEIKNGNYDFIKKTEFKNKLLTVFNRGFSDGFYFGKPINEWTKKYGNESVVKKEFIGKIIKFYSKINVYEIKINSGKIKVGDSFYVQSKKTGSVKTKLVSMEIEKKKISSAKKSEIVGVFFDCDDKFFVGDDIYLIV